MLEYETSTGDQCAIKHGVLLSSLSHLTALTKVDLKLEQVFEFSSIPAPMLQPMCDHCSQLSEVTLPRVEGDAVTLLIKRLHGLRKLAVLGIISALEEDLSAFSCGLEELTVRKVQLPVLGEIRVQQGRVGKAAYLPCYARLPLAGLKKPLVPRLDIGFHHHSATGEDTEFRQLQMTALHADADALVQHFLRLGAEVPSPPLSSCLDLRKPKEASELLQALAPFAAAPSHSLAFVTMKTEQQVELVAASDLGKAATCIEVDLGAIGPMASCLFPQLVSLHVSVAGSKR